MASKIFAVVGICLFVLVICLLSFYSVAAISEPTVSYIPVKTFFGTQIGTIEIEGSYAGLECVLYSEDGYRNAMLGKTGVDPYANSVALGFVKPYEMYCGYNGKMVGVGRVEGEYYEWY